MNISIKHLEHFVAVAQELHFRRAAEVAKVAQPALSRSIQTLENELGVQLLDRNNRNVRLTAAGVEFLAGCTDIIEGMGRTIEKSVRARQNETGVITLGYTYIAMCSKLPKLLNEFSKQYPDIAVETFCISSREQNTRLHHNELDICFLTGPSHSQEINSHVFQLHNFVAIVNKCHPLAKQDSITVQDLCAETIILRSSDTASDFNSHVANMFEKANLTPHIEYIDQNHLGLLGSTVLGKGICIATEGYGCVFEDNLKTLLITGTEEKLPTVMAWRKNHDSDTLTAFRRFALNRISGEARSQTKKREPDPIPEPS